MSCKSRYVILIDFGSTYTKVAVADMEEKKLVKTDHFPSTVSYDARIGLQQCFDAAREEIGKEEFEKALKLSCSSAAGGLRMGVVGVSKTLSSEAGRNAAFGAGAKILKTCTGLITQEDLQELYGLPLEILLFCGGYENGNVSVLRHNADMLAKSNIHVPIIYAGNSKVAPEVRRVFTLNHKEFYVVRNIIPNVGMMDKQQVEEIIRDIFLKRIINMKGLDKVSSMLHKMVMPTPAAVLYAGELLSKGTVNHEGLGDLMIVDVGGATTDIHSYAQQVSYEGAKIVGAAETYVKRTVEGDLGMRESSNSLCAEIGMENMCHEVGASKEEINAVISKWITEKGELALTDMEQKVDHVLASGAVHVSARRHAGYIEHISSAGLKTVQHGKNLSSIRAVIGTGGPMIFGGDSHGILSQVLRTKSKEPDVLLPEEAKFYLDKDYMFFAGGLLREVDEDVAFLLMKNSLTEIY
jgi:uncharacterized protein (TIGR01319 family)